MKKNRWKKGIGVLLSAALCMSVPAEAEAAVRPHDMRALNHVDDISYEEYAGEVVNPGRGFYSPIGISYKEAGNSPSTYTAQLVHYRMDISAFAAKHNGEADKELTADMLDAFEKTLIHLKQKHCSAIIRFAYHQNYEEENPVTEPSMQMILRHQEQLGEVMSRHADVIVSVECGLFGKWGEMHGSSMCNAENFNQAITKWLEVLPDSIPISVRTPGYYADWAGVKRSELSKNVTVRGEDAYRVGVFNDGYLGSESDLGTYVDREEEIGWLKNQARHTLFGGEMMHNPNTEGVNSTASYIEKEAFRTHTSYLNIAWNNTAIDRLKQEDYQGDDPLYQGKKEFEYVRDRLGYRFVVRDVSLTKETTAFENLGIEVKIENTGFANLVKEKKMFLLISDGETRYTFPLSGLSAQKGESVQNADPREWDSKETTVMKASLDLPDDMKPGEYKLYVRLATDTESKGEEGYPVRFANADENIWDQELGANYLAKITVADTATIRDEIETADPVTGGGSVTDNTGGTNTDVSSSKEQTFTVSYGKSVFLCRILSRNDTEKTGAVSVEKILECGKKLSIPSVLDHGGYTYKVTQIGDKAGAGVKATSIVIGKYVKKIGKKAFYGAGKCKTLVIKSSVLNKSKVGKQAFGRMKAVRNVKVPKKKRKAYGKWIFKRGISAQKAVL